MGSDRTAQLAVLYARQEIRELKARYFRFMDCRDWGAMEQVFAEDAIMDMRAEMEILAAVGLPVDADAGLIEGRAAIIEAMSGALVGTQTVHHGHMGEISLLSDEEAEGIWMMEDIVILPEAAGGLRLLGFGHYHERYRLSSQGRWQIAHLRLSRLVVSVD